MKTPFASVIIETITARYDSTSGSLADDLERSLGGMARQTFPREQIETIVVLDHAVPPEAAAEIARRHPSVRLVTSSESNYFAAKNAGAAVADGEIIALLDGDCQPAEDWLETLLSRFEPGVGAVAGRTRYEGRSLVARTFSIPDFAYVAGDDNDTASGFNINNLAFRREVLLAHPFEARIARNGGCYFLFHQLRAAGIRVLYEPRAMVAHGLDIRGFGFVKKHFERGRDGVAVYQLDDRAVLKGTHPIQRAGALALVPIYVRRLAIDWARMLRDRRHIGIHAVALPFFCAVALLTRGIEFAGALAAFVPHPRAT